MDSEAKEVNLMPASIENTFNFDKHQNYIKRYYKEIFQVDEKSELCDMCVLLHSNKLCVITLAPTHPIVRYNLRVAKIDFQVSKNVNRLDNKATGKRKRNAQIIMKNCPICLVSCENGKKYTITSPIAGKLIEINERLQSDPHVLSRNYADNYFEECYVAIINPKHDIQESELTKGLLSLEEYEKNFAGRNIKLSELLHTML